MAPTAHNITLYCGTTVDADNMTFTYRIAGQEVDLTGYSARSQARRKDGSVLFDLSIEDGSITLGGTAGTIVFNLSAQQTSALWSDELAPFGSVGGIDTYLAGKWDLELTSPAGRVVRLLQGKVLLSPETTL